MLSRKYGDEQRTDIATDFCMQIFVDSKTLGKAVDQNLPNSRLNLVYFLEAMHQENNLH